MTPSGVAILDCLTRVEAQRHVRAADASLAMRVRELKRYQQARFERTYADLLIDARHAGAARFFLDELYGPEDFSQRDAQFARIVPALVRLFPQEIVETVGALAALHALSEELDTAMAHHLSHPTVSALDYARAWQQTGDTARRRRQIELMLGVGRSLDQYTRKPLLRHSLRMMRGPARAAGLGTLQQFLESGFDTFRSMKGADVFLQTIVTRETALLTLIFEADLADEAARSALLGQLP
jgi:hypothetical protein